MLDSPEIAQGLSSYVCSESRCHYHVRPPRALMSCVGAGVGLPEGWVELELGFC